MTMTKICLLSVCVLAMVCGVACAADIAVQESMVDNGEGVFTIGASDLEAVEGVGFRLSYDPDYLEITGVTNVSAGYVNYHAHDGNLSVALIFPEALTPTAEEPLVSVAYATLSDEPGSVRMTLHDAEYSVGYQNLTFTHESAADISFRKVAADTVKDGNWSALTPACLQYEVVPGVTIQAPTVSHGERSVFLSDVTVRKYAGGSWVDVPRSDVSVTEDGRVTISGDLRDTAKLNLTFTGKALGDANGNEVVNAADARDIARHAALSTPIDDVGAFYGDVNGNGTPDLADVRDIARYAVGLLDEHFHQR
ncbi:dockerin type I repeat-containing protein [uncultured Methanofollis sp.]|uniref:dockerin type I repeat-containing protein n=1 Tax=uncultured Methanofollis sp. TaxID=262500 RepID=UPI00262DB057|nr:dockerin type I repeat-containing protein [uncultured Methanofollis sp.]